MTRQHPITIGAALLFVASGCMARPLPVMDPVPTMPPVIAPAATPPTLPPAAPVETGSPALTVGVSFPAGTLELLRTSLRTQNAIDPEALSPADLARLQIIVAGETIAPQRLRFRDLRWDASGQITFTVTIAGAAPTATVPIKLHLPARQLTLIGSTTPGSTAVAISVQTTARHLIQAAIDQKGRPDVRPGDVAVDRLAERLAAAIRASAGGNDPFANAEIVRLIDLLADETVHGPRTSSGGGGGGSSSAPSVPEPQVAITIADGVPGPVVFGN